MIQETPPERLQTLLHIYNAIIRVEYWPAPLKHAKVIMIPKPGKDPTDVTSYRPISLLPIISKILESKILLKRIYNVTYFKEWIPLHQFGFRKAHSTVQKCHRLTDVINKALDDQKYCSAIFLDVSQAFDKVWHQGLLIKIKQTLPLLFNLMKSYLSNRYFETTYHSETSPPFPMLSGVPQGSILGPLLYTLYTADIPQSEKNNP